MRARLIASTVVARRSRVGRRRNPGVRREARRWRSIDRAPSRPPNRGARPPEPREPAAERVPALLERDREHGWRPVGDASREPARSRLRRRRRSRRSAPRTPSTSAASSRSPPIPATRSSTSRPSPIFEYHATHNHWHTADVARFEVRRGSPTGPVVGSNSIKIGFCLLDLYRLDGNAPTSGKTFWDCYTSYQGVSVGWVDQYHQATDGQQVVLTGLADANDYYLVSTTNPTGVFLEQDKTNNTEWVKFTLSSDVERQSQGHRHGPLAMREPRDVRRAGDEPLASPRAESANAAGSALAPLDFAAWRPT